MGDQVKGRSRKKLESLIKVTNVVNVKVHFLSFKLILISSPSRVLTPSHLFRYELGVTAKGRSPKKQKNLIEVP